MTFNKKLLTAAVGSALTLGLAAPAQADHQLLFPYITGKDPNKTTIVTVIGTANASGGSVYLQYWTKNTTAAHTAACEANSKSVPFTPNDIVTFDTGNYFYTATPPVGGSPLFKDTTNGTDGLGVFSAAAGARHGYLIVGNDAVTVGGFDGYGGYWLELDVSTAALAAHGDAAASIPEDDDGTGISGAMVLPTTAFAARVPVHLWPHTAPALFKTDFTVTPMGGAMDTNSSNQTTVQLFKSTGEQGLYDRNEKQFDGTVPVTVVCVARIPSTTLVGSPAADPGWSDEGGWGWLRNTGNANAIVYQVDSAVGGGQFISNATRIACDNGYNECDD